jgi:hypothetical protein
MAKHLPDLFRAAGIADVQVHVEDETVQRGDPDFFDAAGIWTHAIETVGAQIAVAGLTQKPRWRLFGGQSGGISDAAAVHRNVARRRWGQTQKRPRSLGACLHEP